MCQYGADEIPRSFDIHTVAGKLTRPAVKLSRAIDEEELINTRIVASNLTQFQNLLKLSSFVSLIHLLTTSQSKFNNIINLFLSLYGWIVHFVKKFQLAFRCQATAR